MSQGIGIVGCGSIGRALLRAGDTGQFGAPIAGVASRTAETALEFLQTLDSPPPYLELGELVGSSSLLIETAGGHVVPQLAVAAFGAGKDLMVISIGALLEHPEVIDWARATGCRLYAPSGAIAGLDGIKSACQGHVDRVEMVSRKPIAALEGAPYLIENEIPIDGLTEAREVFCGSARDACRGFPSNLNVSAAVSLAGIGPDRTTVCIVADPALARNCHDITVEGEFGLLQVHIENIPSENPKTGRLTAMSIIRSVRDVFDPVRIGT
ncbi:L-aspartate dehydrogenase 3 [Geodia barretti]|uniref:Aspartate dehydrogenase domain-containing protein n=2 Tax=Geodia barretti TaxID=519541 RepID=A0AA35WID8_GEOBA|nr:L-aspartate dehydrogenase 3 [Geodia barretti]